MWYIVAFIALLIAGVSDGHTSSFAALALMYILGCISVNSRKNAAERAQGGKVFGIVFSAYVISAFIASQSFLNGQHFYVSDSIKYLERYSTVCSWSWKVFWDTISQTYLTFNDSNALYNESLSIWAYVANRSFDGTSVFYMTLFQTVFGMLACLELYKIFLLYYDSQKAANYTWVFALLSLFHIYSIVIIRDIVIAYFYMLGLRRIMGKPRASDIFLLLLVMIVSMGIRLYTGLFFGTFIMFWLYKLVQDTRYTQYKLILVPLIVIGVAFIVASFASTVIDSTVNQIEDYDELYSEVSGISSKLRKLPFGIRHFVMLFFSQLPLDSLHRFAISSSFSNYYLSFLAIFYKIFGFVVFYGLIYYCFGKGFFKSMSSDNKWIMLIMLIFVALTLSTHMDIRRSMESVPFFYVLYISFSRVVNREQWHMMNRTLVVIGIIIMVVFACLS